MIGVIADPAEHDVVREFFELFKTPWEFWREDRRYDVLICTGEREVRSGAKVVIVYSARHLKSDDHAKILVRSAAAKSSILLYAEDRFPIYGNVISFGHNPAGLLAIEGSDECLAYPKKIGDATYIRVGYDLFAEIRTLLTAGQPPENASYPTVELHITFLRDVITACGESLLEIPPVPNGYQFLVCLTHDVDHPSIRQHKWDHTAIGFWVRAVFGSLVDAVLGRLSVSDLLRNWAAAAKLPFVYLGLARDFWRDFDVRYLEIEAGLPSTFFVIPRKGYPGKRLDGSAPVLRGSGYAANEITGTINNLVAAGCEVGLHGIDAWLDSSVGSDELNEIRRLSGSSEIGTRMHWLYYDDQSPTALEKAGAAYDSTIGYNVTVGYRAGTTQAYKPLQTNQLLELPLHAMDTALFYLSYLGLCQRKANLRLRELADNAERYGGCLVINWHDRSLAPERLWGGTYRELIQDLKARGAWFATAGQAVSWFRKRRSATIEIMEDSSVRIRLSNPSYRCLPDLRLRAHRGANVVGTGIHHSGDYVDISAEQCGIQCVPFERDSIIPREV
jgi:peptidoglycan/xylan/chitin deacetylase (PgdA/CDA1 family)